jgi:uncharacterized membrane protein
MYEAQTTLALESWFQNWRVEGTTSTLVLEFALVSRAYYRTACRVTGATIVAGIIAGCIGEPSTSFALAWSVV